MQQKPNHNSWIMGDGHVHIHKTFDLETLFPAALNNFQQHTQSLGLQGKIHHFLLLTESAGTEAFIQLRQSPNAVKDFTIQATGDENCLQIKSNQDTGFSIVAGRQIVTAESLEVLALGLDRPYPDDKPIQNILEDLQDENCLLVLPWGPGKWLGKRGKIIERAIRSFHTPSFFLLDNGNRPFFWPRSALFSQAAERGITNLQGSDPLPFPNQEKRVGSYGFFFPGTIGNEHPFKSLVHQLTAPENNLQSYGNPERALPFFHVQISMQLSKRLHAGRS